MKFSLFTNFVAKILKHWALVFLLAAIVPVFSWAHSDLEFSGSLRTIPWGGGLTASGGKSFLLWGQAPVESGDKNFRFGYLRPAASFQTAASYNSGSIELDIFPISIFGLSVGGSARENTKDYQAYNCNLLECNGRLTRRFLKAKGAVAAKGFILSTSFTWEDLWAEHKNLPFVDEHHGVSGNRGHDSARCWVALLGYTISEQWIVGLYHKEATSMGASQTSRMDTVNIVLNHGEWKYILGAGQFASPLEERSFTAIGRISWTPLKKLGFL